MEYGEWIKYIMHRNRNFLNNKKIVDNVDKNRYNKCKESKEYAERRLLYGTCKGYIKRTDYNTNRD